MYYTGGIGIVWFVDVKDMLKWWSDEWEWEWEWECCGEVMTLFECERIFMISYAEDGIVSYWKVGKKSMKMEIRDSGQLKRILNDWGEWWRD